MAAINCIQCDGVVALDARACPHCGTSAFIPSGKGSGAVIALISVALVLGAVVGGYRLLFVEPDPRLQLSETDRAMFDKCVAAFRRIDPRAVVMPRPNSDKRGGLYMGWPSDSPKLLVNGLPTRGSCMVEGVDASAVITLNGKDR